MSGDRAAAAPLLDRLRAEASRRAAPTPGGDYDFAELPQFRGVRLQLDALESLGLELPFYRLNEAGPGTEARIDGATPISFASYDYLGLNGHPAVAAAAEAAIRRWGVSASASRLVGGERPYHRTLERALAELHGTDAAVAFVSGHATNVTAIAALVGPEDLVILDALAHNSVTVGAQLSGAHRLTMPHNDLGWLERTLAERRGRHRHVLIAVEGLYSMDGDAPDLPRLVEIKRRHHAWLMVDEAHALGALGPTGRGSAEAAGLDPRSVDIWMGTLSKALASCGGYICGSEALVRVLRARASGFVFSVGLAAPVAAAAEAAILRLRAEPERVARLRTLGARFLAGARAAGLDTGFSEGHAITPILLGESLRALRASAALLERGILAFPVVHPAVPERAARLRFFLTSEHREAEIDRAVATTAEVVATL